jgi:hypothetical protein
LPGYIEDSITIKSGDAAGTQVVSFKTDGSKEITKETAIESLGDKAKRYVVKSLETSEGDT